MNAEGEWLPLWRHMDDAASMAGLLFDRWLAPSVVRRLAAEFGGSVEEARTAVVFLAGAHDIGKATPAFAIQHDTLAQRMRDRGLYSPPSKRDLVDRRLVHHSLAGHHILIEWLTANGWSRGRARCWGVVLGGHHGAPPDPVTEMNSPEFYEECYGTHTWRDVQTELLERVAATTGAARFLQRWQNVMLSAGFQVLVTGLVIVADWIVSNEELLPYLRDDLPEVIDDPQRVARALGRLRLPEPWRPGGVPEQVGELFRTRFALPKEAQPRPVQHAACEVAKNAAEPGLMIVEAPMGEGKTEAALAASEIMAAKWGAGGVFVALPTQATSDAMFARVVDWLDALGDDGQQVAGAITLGHGKARFNRLFQGLVRGSRIEVGRDDAHGGRRHAVAVHSWLSGRKKASLANFMVGTVDQLLFAGLKSRHLMLRHLGLAGKVVVLDEVHAYDAYMNSYLTRVLTWLGAYRVPVVALSATLPSDRRRALLEAYREGHRFGVEGKPVEFPDIPSTLNGDIGYPVVSWSEGAEVRTRAVEPSGRRTDVALEILDGGVDDDLDAVVALLRDTLADGGCAAVVRNTVRRVLATARRLEEQFPGEVTVAHSQFLIADRMRSDGALLDRFGSPSRATRRPGRHIVVASQVIEQSLDVDFDLLITDLAPIDLVLQRMGRLHRHQRGEGQNKRPKPVRQARALVTGVDLSGEVPEFELAAARHIYGEHALLRSAAVLLPRLGGQIALPGDIPTLVQRAYGAERIEPEAWRDASAEALARSQEKTRAREDKAGNFQIAEPSKPGKAIVGWVSADVGDTDDEGQGQGQVRDGAPTLEAIVVCEDDAGRWRVPEWLSDGAELRVPREETPSEELAQVLAACGLRLPLEFSNADAEEELWAATPPEWEYSPSLYRTPVLVIDENGRGELAGRRFRYTPTLGLEVFSTTDDA
ncbi:CRISPR-associated helicase Cas3' [Saccharopolyspora sp. ID03-671]|uniref:CRISPR-associated helicase Cas3' n=1 Tax=Saccharopolyspora sp. ID03-671 TaxID=3073066 RepID=UPI0032495AEF